MPGSRVGWPRGSTLVGVGEDCFVMLIDGIVVACPPVRGLRRVVFLITLAPLRTFEISFCCGRRSSSSATATPRSCSAAATLRPCRSGGSRPWCGRRVRLVHPRATTTAARVSRNGPNDCEVSCNIATMLPFYGSECHSSDKGPRSIREADSPATAEGRRDDVASLLPVRRPPPGDGRRRITADSRSNIDEYPASAR